MSKYPRLDDIFELVINETNTDVMLDAKKQIIDFIDREVQYARDTAHREDDADDDGYEDDWLDDYDDDDDADDDCDDDDDDDDGYEDDWLDDDDDDDYLRSDCVVR